MRPEPGTSVGGSRARRARLAGAGSAVEHCGGHAPGRPIRGFGLSAVLPSWRHDRFREHNVEGRSRDRGCSVPASGCIRVRGEQGRQGSRRLRRQLLHVHLGLGAAGHGHRGATGRRKPEDCRAGQARPGGDRDRGPRGEDPPARRARGRRRRPREGERGHVRRRLDVDRDRGEGRQPSAPLSTAPAPRTSPPSHYRWV